MDIESARRSLHQLPHSDGQIVNCHLESDRAIILFRDWRYHTWRFEFGGVVFFRSYEFGGDVETIHISDEGDTLKEAIARILRANGKPGGYPDLLALEFVSDSPIMTIVFQTLQISPAIT